MGSGPPKADKAQYIMYAVYVLKSKSNGKRYIGQTANLAKRVCDHNNGMSKYTKNRGPWGLVYQERYGSRSEAMIREKFLKSGKGREMLDKINK